jgi:zinc transporter ZupT
MADIEFTIIVLLIAVVLSIVHYYSHRISGFMEKNHYDVLSFSGGTLIALIFLVLLPEVIGITDSEVIFLLILLGFIAFHLTEKYLYQHVKNKRQQLRDLKELHQAGFFIDHSSSISLDHIHEKAKTSVNKTILSVSTLLGAITAIILEIDKETQAAVLALTLGMLIYIVNRDILPKEEKGKSLWFIAGIGLIILIWIALIL